MKRFKIYYMVLLLIFTSCSKNDDGTINEVPESNRPSMFTITDDSDQVTTYEMTYTEFDKIETIRISFDDLAFRMDFTYDADNKLSRYNNGNGTIIDIAYGADGKLSSYSSLMFNAAITETPTGFKTVTDGLFTKTYIFNSTEQLTKIEDIFFADIIFNVETGGSGAFINVDIDNILFALPSFNKLYFNKQAFSNTVNFRSEPILNFNNTFNSNGLLKKSIVYVTEVSTPKLTIEYFY